MENPKTSYVYLLVSTKGATYVGATVDLNRRLRQHNKEIKGGAHATSAKVAKGETWRRHCYVSGFPNWSAALQFEWRWKQITRKQRKEHKEPTVPCNPPFSNNHPFSNNPLFSNNQHKEPCIPLFSNNQHKEPCNPLFSNNRRTPLDGRMAALDTLLSLDRSTTKAIPYAEWPTPPVVHVE